MADELSARGAVHRPIRVLWLLGNDRAKADTTSLLRWWRAADRRRIALTVAFLSPPGESPGRPSPGGEFDAADGSPKTIPAALAAAGAEVLHWPGAHWLSPSALRRAARFLAERRIDIVQSVYLRADVFAAALMVLAGRSWINAPLGQARSRVSKAAHSSLPSASDADRIEFPASPAPPFIPPEGGRRGGPGAARRRRLLRERPVWLVRTAGIGTYRRTRLRGPGGGWLDRLVYRRADGFVAVSRAVRDDWSSRLSRPAADFEVIHNCAPDLHEAFGDGPHGPASSEVRGAIRRRYGFAVDDTLAICVSRLDREKGVETLVEAAGRLRDSWPRLRWLVLGDGPRREALSRLAAGLGLLGTPGPRLVLAGHRPDIGPHLLAADLFVLPSRMEGCPNALLEAASAELPIVATAVGGVPELVTHEREAILVAPAGGPGAAAALAAGVARLLADRALAARLGAAAQARVRLQFSPAATAEKYAALYERVARRR